MVELLALRIQVEQDIALARRRTRRVTEVAGLDERTRTRIATAASEAARYAQAAGGGRMTFSVQGTAVARLVVDVTARPAADDHDRARRLLAPAARLLDDLEVVTGPQGEEVIRF